VISNKIVEHVLDSYMCARQGFFKGWGPYWARDTTTMAGRTRRPLSR
jgi:hypothetical protein